MFHRVAAAAIASMVGATSVGMNEARAAPLLYEFDLVLGQRHDSTPAIFDGRTVTGTFSYSPQPAPGPIADLVVYDLPAFDVTLGNVTLVTGVLNSRGDSVRRIIVDNDSFLPDRVILEGTLNQSVDGYDLRAFGIILFGLEGLLATADLAPLPPGTGPDERFVGRLSFVNHQTGDEVFVDGAASVRLVSVPVPGLLGVLALGLAGVLAAHRARPIEARSG